MDFEQNGVKMFSNLWNKGGFILCTKGRAELSINGIRHHFSQGEVLVITPLVLVGEVNVSEEFAALSFVDDLKSYYDIFNRIADSPIPLMVYREPIWRIGESEQQYLAKQHAHLEQLARSMAASAGETARSLLDFQRRLLRQEAMLTAVNSHIEQVEWLPSSNSREVVVYRFILALHNNYRTHRSVAYYAAMANLSKSHFSAIVKQTTGQSPSAWIATITTTYAKFMLENSSMNIKQIAEQLNFPEQFTFRKYFKQHTGLSPKAYREQFLHK